MADGRARSEPLLGAGGAIEEPIPRVQELLSSVGEEEDGEEIDIDEQARRMRRRRDELRMQLEVVELEEQLAARRRLLAAGVTPGPSVASSSAGDDDSISVGRSATPSVRTAFAPEASSRRSGGRPRLREPPVFKGKTIKEARDFLTALELTFALMPDAYETDASRVLYGVMYLGGEPSEQWHLNHSVGDLQGYTWSEFRQFVQDAVEDPVNRSLTNIVAYETARQKEGQSVTAFATELATLEDQIAAYTPEQRVQHLLAKLRPELRTDIITYHKVPSKRDDLVSLATRLEQAKRRVGSGSGGSQLSHKRNASEAQKTQGKKKRHLSPNRSAALPNRGRGNNDNVTCWTCNEKGHYSTDCPQKGRGDKAATRKVTASEKKAKTKESPPKARD